jgi:hypothetical protein
MDLDNGTASIELSSGNISSTGLTDPIYYVNSIESQAVTLNS